MASTKNIELLRNKLKAGFLPNQSIRVFMPKSNGLSRMYTLLSIEDQIVYQAYANIIANALLSNSQITKRYKKSVFGNLCASPDSNFFYQRWQDSYKAYTKAIIKTYQKGYKYIASFDLTACYDSINHHLLGSVLKDICHFSDKCVSSFVQLLGKWESADGRELGTGIPQGPQASGIIAEVVLQEYDSYVENLQKTMHFSYYRYVDDIRILAADEDTVKWALFLLDKKSKELGLFPQSSKISTHEITDINNEIKRISKPLFEDDLEEAKKPQIAFDTIRKLLKENSTDLTTIRRYFQCVTHNTKTNKMAISLVKKYPNLIHSFAYYVQRYPRIIPPSISDYVYGCCFDKTQQFAAGIILEAIMGKLNKTDAKRFSELAKSELNKDKRVPFIVDSRYKVQLLLLILKYDAATFGKRRIDYIKKSNWWVVSNFILSAEIDSHISILKKKTLESFIISEIPDVSLAMANYYLLSGSSHSLPPISNIAPVAQNVLKESGLILRSQYSNSQINKYLSILTNTQYKTQWKKKLGKEHSQVERNLFTAIGYWKTDLTAFVNLFDSINDRICSILTSAHPELGGYSLGNIGGIQKSKGFSSNMPKYHKMCMAIHDLRLSSYLSHAEIRKTHTYTGPIHQSKRKSIQRLIKDGIDELTSYW